MSARFAHRDIACIAKDERSVHRASARLARSDNCVSSARAARSVYLQFNNPTEKSAEESPPGSAFFSDVSTIDLPSNVARIYTDSSRRDEIYFNRNGSEQTCICAFMYKPAAHADLQYRSRAFNHPLGYEIFQRHVPAATARVTKGRRETGAERKREREKAMVHRYIFAYKFYYAFPRRRCTEK